MPNVSVYCPQLRAWSPEDPALYNAEIWSGEDLIGRQVFGIMDMRASQDHIYLNGKPYYIRGYIRGLKAHDHANFSFATKEEFYEHHIRVAKAYGFNYVRWHSTIPDEAFLYQADRLGLLCHVEFSFKPIWGKDSQGGNVLAGVEFDEKSVRETVARLSVHPCIAVYCLGNEIHNSGRREEVRRLLSIIREIDPSKLVMDNCGWGEYDRETSDIFCQHIGYYFPWGAHSDMFDSKDVFALDGSVRGPLKKSGTGELTEAINPARPVLAHEVLHYISWPDAENLKVGFKDRGFPEPWWLDEILKLEAAKGIEGEKKALVMAASRKFASICIKEAIERIRKSTYLQGFMMLQLADTHYYENQNGLLDCFDKPKFIAPEEFRKINSDIVLLLDLEKCCFRSGEEYEFDLSVSNYSVSDTLCAGSLCLSIYEEDRLLQEFSCAEIKLFRREMYSLGRFTTVLPHVEKPTKLTLRASLKTNDGHIVENNWDIWMFPETDMPGIEDGSIVTVFLNDTLLDRVKAGEKVLWLYNPEAVPCPEGSLFLPHVKDHFKPVIWDRGHQMGGIVRQSPVLGDFPHDGVMDFQLANLVEGAVKINLDDFPVAIDPVIEGLDRPVRDRVAVIEGRSTGFDPKYYMRKFGYLLDLAIGEGHLIICTFNFSDAIESNYLLSQLVAYLESSDSSSAVRISADEFKSFCESLPKAGLIEELPMTEYWQRDDLPVETKLFWEDLGVDITKL